MFLVFPDLNTFNGKPSTRACFLRDVRQNYRFLSLQNNGEAGSSLQRYLV